MAKAVYHLRHRVARVLSCCCGRGELQPGDESVEEQGKGGTLSWEQLEKTLGRVL